MTSLKLISQLFWLATIAQSILVLHGAMFFATCLGTSEQETSCRGGGQKSCHTFQSRAALAMVSKQPIQLLQKLEQSSTSCNCCKPKTRHKARQFVKRACMSHAASYLQLVSQRHCNTSFKQNCTVYH